MPCADPRMPPPKKQFNAIRTQKKDKFSIENIDNSQKIHFLACQIQTILPL